MPSIKGSEILALPRERVWELFNDPEALGVAIPGCHGLERDGNEEHRYRTSIAVAIGAVKGVYEGTVTYVDIVEPERATVKLSARGDKGTIDGQGAIELREEEAGTEVTYQGDFKLTGPVAGLGQRLAPGVSRKMIVETLRNLERNGKPPAPDEAASSEAAPATGAGDRPPTRESEAAPRSPVTASEVEPFSPVPQWVQPVGMLVLGLVVGFVIGIFVS